MVIANTDKPSFSEGNELYTEVQDTEDQNKEKQKHFIDQRTDNPFHRDLVIANTNKPSFSEGNELYNEVQDTEDQNKEKQKHFIDQRTDNPLYGDADVGDAVFNPIYDRYDSSHTKIWNRN